MALTLVPLGRLVLDIDRTFAYPGPIAIRSSTTFKGGTWSGDNINLNVMWATALYLRGAVCAEVDLRVALEDSGGRPLVLRYLARVGDIDAHVRGETPAYLTGQVDVEEGDETYQFLNRTQVVGKAFLNMRERKQEYEMYYLE
jgi:Protein of unknown function (DUF3237)